MTDFSSFHQRIHKLASYFLREMHAMPITEATIETRLFDIMLDHAVKERLILGLDPVPPSGRPDRMVINIMGRPVTLTRQKAQ